MPPMPRLPLIIAHRGASHDAPENTLPTFKLAWQQHADGIEGDFHLTADGQIVCIHDTDTARVAGEKLIVREESLAALRRLDVGAWRGRQHCGAVIPTLAEVMATVPHNKTLDLEIKCGTEIMTPLSAELGRSALAPAQITIISFNAEVIAAVKEQLSPLRALWLVNFAAAGAPTRAATLDTLSHCRADGLGSSPGIEQALAEEVLARGYHWHVWTVDDAERARRLQRWGAQCITTNMPARLRQALSANAPST